MKQKKRSVDEILEKLTTKRGKHSELWMWPKKESLEEARQELKQVVMEAIGEDENGAVSSESRIGNAWQIARNALRAEIRANIEKLFSEEV